MKEWCKSPHQPMDKELEESVSSLKKTTARAKVVAEGTQKARKEEAESSRTFHDSICELVRRIDGTNS